MPNRARPRIAPTDDWEHLQLILRWPEQVAYELIRPIVLFGRSPDERARETSRLRRTLHCKALQFDRFGMSSLFAPLVAPTRVDPQHSLPTALRQAIMGSSGI
jgi:putative transposase